MTASDVSRAGGRGVPVQTDHTRVEDVRALVSRIEADAGRLDVLVNAAWGGQAGRQRAAVLGGAPRGLGRDRARRRLVRPADDPLCRPAPYPRAWPLVVTVSFGDRGRYAGRLGSDLTTAALERFAFGTARDFEPQGVTSVALSPGFVRTERTLAAFGASERRWTRTPRARGQREPALYRPGRREPGRGSGRPRTDGADAPGRRPRAALRVHRRRRPAAGGPQASLIPASRLRPNVVVVRRSLPRTMAGRRARRRAVLVGQDSSRKTAPPSGRSRRPAPSRLRGLLVHAAINRSHEHLAVDRDRLGAARAPVALARVLFRGSRRGRRPGSGSGGGWRPRRG